MSYSYSSIKILKGLDAVKKRPGMYIGNTEDGTGFHHMVFEVIDNSIDEVLSGFCNYIYIKIYNDNSISIKDNGRGIPTELNEEYNKSYAELIMTILHAGGKFDNNAYKISGGLHGVGLSVVNALSSKLELIIYRNKEIYKQIYNYGYPKSDLLKIGKTNETGTFIKFWPDKNIFTENNIFQYYIIHQRLKELSFLNKNLNIIIEDERIKKIEEIKNTGGIKSFIKELLNNKNVLHNNYFYINTNKNNLNIELILQWTNSFKEKFLCFTNNIKQKDGGSHLSGLKLAITKTINNYIISEPYYNKKIKSTIISDDIREGIISIISIKFPNPKFSSQTKDKLISSEIKPIIENIVSEKLMEFLLENSNDSKLIINKIIQSSLTREAVKKAKEITRKKNQIENTFNLVGKLSDCQIKDPKLTELYLVEGDSAGGSAKQARDRKNQAVLSLKGKILNVEKSNLDKILISKEIINLITSIGCGIEKTEYNINKLRYHKIIIMTDADIDGSHIRTLLLTFFYRYIPDLINKGHLYIAQPPLYKISKGKYEKYIKNDYEFINYKISFILKNLKFYINLENINEILIKKLIYKYINIKKIINDINNKIPSDFIFCLIENYKSNINDLNNNELIKYINNLLLNINKKIKFKKYSFINKGDDKFILKEFNNGIYINYIINKNFFESIEYIKMMDFSKNILYFIEKIKHKNENIDLNKLYIILNNLIKESLKGIYIHRYKGLGEMNPNQLWKTTMDPKNRNLLKIVINNNEETNKLFNILMGESVDLRKEFIEKNCLNAKNIDV